MPRTQITYVFFLLLCRQIFAASAWQETQCAKGEYRLSRGDCVPCKKCGDLRVISPCSPSHDAVCADDLVSKVFHFRCTEEWSTFSGSESKGSTAEEEEKEEEWGLFVEARKTSFRSQTKKEKTRAWRKICNSLKKYRKRIFFSTSHHHPFKCMEGTYRWLWTTRDNSSSSEICRPCSQCPNGSHEMFACGGFQDTFCSFDRINNTLELFHMKCQSQGPTLQVYSSLRPSVSQARLQVIKSRLQHSVCKAINKTIWKPSAGAVLNEEDKPTKHGSRRSGQEDGDISTTLTGQGQPRIDKLASDGGKIRYWILSENHRGQDAKSRKSQLHRSRKNSHDKEKRKRMKKKNGRKSARRKVQPAASPDSSRADRKGTQERIDNKVLLDMDSLSGREESDSAAIAYGEVASFPQLTLAAADSRPTTMVTSATTTHTDNAPPWTGMTSAKTVITETGSSIPREPELEAEDEEEDDGGIIRNHEIYLAVVGGVAAVLLMGSIMAFLCFRRRTRKRREGCINDSVNGAYAEENQNDVSLSVNHFSTKMSRLSSYVHHSIPLVSDPLSLKNRPKSHDSGYSTVHSEGSQQGSRCLCIESQGNYAYPRASCVASDLTRNAVSTDEVADAGRSPSPSSNSPMHGPSVLGARPPQQGCAARRARSLSEEYSFSAAAGFRPRTTRGTPSPLGSSLRLYHLDAESSCSRDEGIENSQGSVFSVTSFRDYQEFNVFVDAVRPHTVDINYSFESLPEGSDGPKMKLNLDSELAEDRGSRVSSPCADFECDEPVSEEPRLNNHASDRAFESPISDYVFSHAEDSARLLKSRPSSASSTCSCVSIQLRIAMNSDLHQNMHTDWLHKDKDVGPENVLSTYSYSVATQTEDWTKSNLRPRPVLCSSWQGCQNFTYAGGLWSLPGSDVRLEVPPKAVPSGHSVDVTGATYTNLPHLRQLLKLADQDIFVGPLVELDAGPGFRFQKDVGVFLPHCLPAGLAAEHIRLHHVDRGEDGEVIIRRLSSKQEYDVRKQGAESALSVAGREGRAEDDIGYFQFLSSGELVVVTKRFCGFACSICSNHILEPQIYLVVTAKQLLKARPSGDVPQVRVFLHLWDRKITITDFKRDYLGSGQVGDQVLHVIDEFKDSLMKINLTINEEESQQQWKHALRPGSTMPIFPAERSFRLRELLCCQAKDSPRLEEWLAENLQVQSPGAPCYDFQCFIDVANVAHPACSQWQEPPASRQHPLESNVTLFVHDISSSSSSNSNNNSNSNSNSSGSNSVLGVPKEVKGQGEGHSSGRQATAEASQMNSVDSDTPCGRMEQGPSCELDFSDVPGWQPLSDDVRLEPSPPPQAPGIISPWPSQPSRGSDPSPQVHHVADQCRPSHGRPASCPESAVPFEMPALTATASETAVAAEGRRVGTEAEAEQQQQQARAFAGPVERQMSQNGHDVARNGFSTHPEKGGTDREVHCNPGKYPEYTNGMVKRPLTEEEAMRVQFNPDQHPEHASGMMERQFGEGARMEQFNPGQHSGYIKGMVKGPLTGEGARPKVINAEPHHHHVEQHPRVEASPWSRSPRGPGQLNTGQEGRRGWTPSIEVHVAGSPHPANRTGAALGYRHESSESATEETVNNQPVIVLSDSAHNINMLFC